MKKVFRKIQKGTTKMIERIKSLGEMETKQKCVVQRFEIIIPLHQKITTQYIASASFTCGFFSYRRLDKGFFVKIQDCISRLSHYIRISNNLPVG